MAAGNAMYRDGKIAREHKLAHPDETSDMSDGDDQQGSKLDHETYSTVTK